MDACWDSARKTYKQNSITSPANASVHALCGQAIELVLKASVASRTLDNITGVIVAFKNFRKSIKNAPESVQQKLPNENYRQGHISNLLGLPNGDLTWEDV